MPQTIFLENTENRLEISTLGGQVLSWKSFVKGIWRDILYTENTHKRSGIPILFPFANPLENDIFLASGAKMPQHGFARNLEWNLLEKSSDQVILSLNFTSLSTELRSAFPFPFELSLTVKLNPNNSIDHTLVLNNMDKKDLPIAPGIHPYFSLAHAAKASLKIEQIPEFEAQKFAWDLDLSGDFYPFKGEISASFPDYELNICEIAQNPDCEFLVIWSQNTAQKDYNFVCLEPFYRQTNALNNNPILVKSGESWTSSFRFSVK